jgi:predicted ArsR family transcriptional regulator
MAKKVKLKSSETFELKKVMAVNKNKSKKDQIVELFKVHPEFNRSEAADILGVSRQTIKNWLKDIK